MKYFNNCKTKEEAKAEYRKLAKQLHPDAGGSQEGMIELQRQYDAFAEPTIFGSENAFRESVYNKYRQQNADSPYFRTYQFNTINSGNNGEVMRLRDENTKLRSQLYQYESQMRNKDNSITMLSNQKHILEMEIKATQSHAKHVTKQVDELRKQNNELLSTHPKTAWATIKHFFKLLGKPYNEYA